jgi:hypothetical protein
MRHGRAPSLRPYPVRGEEGESRGAALASSLLAALILAGCGALKDERQPTPPPIKPPTTYVKPAEIEVLSDTSRRVWQPKKAVWKRYTQALTRARFFVDHADEAAGTMTVHYSGDPLAYVDCGKVVINTKGAQGDTTFDFPAATAYKRYQLVNRGKSYEVERRMGLEARLNVTLESSGAEQTIVKAQSTYFVTRNQTAVAASAKPLVLNDTISFGGGESAVFSNAATKCQATGKLEAEVLGLLK